MPAPFSDLSGHDRILVVIEGRGLVLRSDDGRALDAREPFRPVRFRGEDVIVSELEDGPVEVVNLMGDRAAIDLDLRVLDGAGSIVASAGDLVLYAPGRDASCSIGGRRVAIPGGDGVRLSLREDARVEGGAGLLVVAIATARVGAGTAPE